LSDLTNKLIPLLEKHPIQGVKYLDYLDFFKVIGIINKNLHLTKEGLNNIKMIKDNMNKRRV